MHGVGTDDFDIVLTFGRKGFFGGVTSMQKCATIYLGRVSVLSQRTELRREGFTRFPDEGNM